MNKILIHNKSNLKTIDYKKLLPMQGDFKKLSEKSKGKLKSAIIKYGFAFPFFVWIDNDKFYINDGHQRHIVLAELEKEGYEISEVPYIEIEAKTIKEAAKLLLLLNSRFGNINVDTSFMENFKIDEDFYKQEIQIPELDFEMEFIEIDGLEKSNPDHEYSGHSTPFRLGDMIAYIIDDGITSTILKINKILEEKYHYNQKICNIIGTRLLHLILEDINLEVLFSNLSEEESDNLYLRNSEISSNKT